MRNVARVFSRSRQATLYWYVCQRDKARTLERVAMPSFPIGYGRGEIEPGIALLVEAVQGAGFVSFASCEGHLDDDGSGIPRRSSVCFYAAELAAKGVHLAMLEYRSRFRCSWVLTATFVAHRMTNQWTLGWNLENWGTIEEGPPDTFEERTLKAAWEHDIPVLIEMFGRTRRG